MGQKGRQGRLSTISLPGADFVAALRLVARNKDVLPLCIL